MPKINKTSNSEIYSNFIMNKHWSVECKASFFGVSVPSIRKWEQGANIPDYAIVIIEQAKEINKYGKVAISIKSEKNELERKIRNYFTAEKDLKEMLEKE